MVRYKIMVREKNERRWLNWNKNKYRSPQIETYKTRVEAEKRVSKLKPLYKNYFKVVKK